MVLDGLLAQEEHGRGLPIRLALGHEQSDVNLPEE
jgi:hypothetical protein